MFPYVPENKLSLFHYLTDQLFSAHLGVTGAPGAQEAMLNPEVHSRGAIGGAVERNCSSKCVALQQRLLQQTPINTMTMKVHVGRRCHPGGAVRN